MTLTRDLIMLSALIVLGAVLLLIYAGLALAVFRCEKLDKRRRWYGLVIPGAALPLAYYTERKKRANLFVVLLVVYLVLRYIA